MSKFGLGVGFPSGILRLAAGAPLVIYQMLAAESYELVRDHDILQQPPFNHNILRAERIAAKWVSHPRCPLSLLLPLLLRQFIP